MYGYGIIVCTQWMQMKSLTTMYLFQSVEFSQTADWSGLPQDGTMLVTSLAGKIPDKITS
jgi:hypothetical protein